MSTCFVQVGMKGKIRQIKGDNTVKPPREWKTGDEPMTGAQRSYVHTLADEAHVKVPEEMTKAEAAEKIDELQEKVGLDG